MSSAVAQSPGGCGCGGGDVFCGSPCAACGGFKWVQGTVSDANGTYDVFPGVNTAWQAFSSGGVFSDPDNTCSSLVDGTAHYSYLVSCTAGGQIRVNLHVPGGYCFRMGDPGILYYGYFGDLTHLGNMTATSTASPSSCDPSVVSNHTFTGWSVGYPSPPAFPPVGTVTVTLFKETPKAQVCCSPCPIPKKDLTLKWTNTFLGTGTTPLVYSPGQWASGCDHQLLYSLSCAAGQTQFTVTYFTTGTCPDGNPDYCTSGGINPHRLVLSSYTCSPLHLTYTLTASTCTILGDNGYTQFEITDP